MNQEIDVVKTSDPVGVKNDKNKTMFSLLPTHATAAVAEVLTYGAKKYAPNNYKYVKGWKWRYIDAALRHIWEHMKGNKFDDETGMWHIAHACSCLLMLLDNNITDQPFGDYRDKND